MSRTPPSRRSPLTASCLTPADVAQRYGVNESKVLGWIRAGQLCAVNVARDPNGQRPRWRIAPDALESFEMARQSRPAAPPSSRRPKPERPAGWIDYF